MAKIRVPTDVHPGEAVMDGVDRAYEHLLHAQSPADRQSDERQAGFLDELRALGRARRSRRATSGE